MRRLICSVIAVALLLIARTTRANTIQPILVSVTPTGGGDFVFGYDILLTNDNGLANTSTAQAGFESGLIMPDFRGFTGTASLSSLPGDVTTASDWGNTVYTPTDGGGPLLNVTNSLNVSTTIIGFPPSNGVSPTATVGDASALTNIVLQYQGLGLATSIAPRSLIHLFVTSHIGLVSLQNTLSRDTEAGGGRPVETFRSLMPDSGGGPFLPLPSTAGLGVVLLGGLGFGRIRRMNLA